MESYFERFRHFNHYRFIVVLNFEENEIDKVRKGLESGLTEWGGCGDLGKKVSLQIAEQVELVRVDLAPNGTDFDKVEEVGVLLNPVAYHRLKRQGVISEDYRNMSVTVQEGEPAF